MTWQELQQDRGLQAPRLQRYVDDPRSKADNREARDKIYTQEIKDAKKIKESETAEQADYKMKFGIAMDLFDALWKETGEPELDFIKKQRIVALLVDEIDARVASGNVDFESEEFKRRVFDLVTRAIGPRKETDQKGEHVCPKCEACSTFPGKGRRRRGGKAWGYAAAGEITGFGTCPTCARGEFLWRGPINDNPFDESVGFGEEGVLAWDDVKKTRDETNDDLDATYRGSTRSAFVDPSVMSPYSGMRYGRPSNGAAYEQNPIAGGAVYNSNFTRGVLSAPLGSYQRAQQAQDLFTPVTVSPQAVARNSFYAGKLPAAPQDTFCPAGSVYADGACVSSDAGSSSHVFQSVSSGLNQMQQNALGAYQTLQNQLAPPMSFASLYS